MLKYKFNVGDALERAGFTTYKAKKTGLLSQDTLRKIKNEETNITLGALNSICMILDLQPKDILIYVETEEEEKKKQELF
nr:MAG TPA: Cro/C1-type HTH DNA-binding domain protein [Bacteriophage sp.]